MSEVLHLVKGATFQESLTITARDGTPTDLTGAVITWMAKARIDDADVDAVLTASTTAGTITITDAAAGALAFAVPDDDTDVLDAGRRYVWTLQIVVGGVTLRYPDGFQKGPGLLLVTASAVSALP